MQRTLFLSLVAAVVCTGAPRVAEACGGCFSPPEEVTTVESHRMVISLSPERTTLWDQIRYTGDPADFVWVLPVPTSVASLEVADPVFFEELEAQTAPRISPPPLPPPPSCPPPPSGGGIGTPDAATSASDAPGVDVYREEVVGPYEVVVIGSEDATALHTWLQDHNYNVPPETLPVLDHYVAAGSKFIVLRLAPDQGVSAMQPVRVRYPGHMATFPLKMVTVGAYGTLDLTLWVVAEQRYDAWNYGTVTVDPTDLVWDFSQARSNYGTLFAEAIDEAGGRAWVAEFAQPFSYLWFSATEEAEIATRNLPGAFVTRLRTSTLVDHLTDDLQLAPSRDATWISRELQAEVGINTPPPPQCPDWNGDGIPDNWPAPDNDRLFGCSVGAGRHVSAGLGAAVLAALLLSRRLRRRR